MLPTRGSLKVERHSESEEVEKDIFLEMEMKRKPAYQYLHQTKPILRQRL